MIAGGETVLIPAQHPTAKQSKATAQQDAGQRKEGWTSSSVARLRYEGFAPTDSCSSVFPSNRSQTVLGAAASANVHMNTQYRFKPESGAQVVPTSWIDSGAHQSVGSGNETFYAILFVPGTLLRYEVDGRTGKILNGPLGETPILRTLYVREDAQGAIERDNHARVDTSGETTSYAPREFTKSLTRPSDAGDPVPKDRQSEYRELLVELHDLDVTNQEEVVNP